MNNEQSQSQSQSKPQIGIGKPFQRRSGVNALQWDGESLTIFKEFTGAKCQIVEKDLFIDSPMLMGSQHVVNVGDWVVFGTNGFMIWPDVKFKSEFEPVNPSKPEGYDIPS